MRRTTYTILFVMGFAVVSALSLELAEDYLNFEWTVYEANVMNNYTSSGDPHQGYTQSHPCDWVDSIGVTITGMPYHYGGKDAIEQWNDDYENGGKGPGAHSIHYAPNPPSSLSWAAGIDCSGFVGRCWELPETVMPNCGCGYLTTISSEITDQQVQPGDAFISSAHARLCYARIEDDPDNQFVEVAEAVAVAGDEVINMNSLDIHEIESIIYVKKNS